MAVWIVVIALIAIIFYLSSEIDKCRHRIEELEDQINKDKINKECPF
jgi:cell division protein FtsL